MNWEHAWDRARAVAYWNSDAYETAIFQPSRHRPPQRRTTGISCPEQIIEAKVPGKYSAHCPAHEDSSASLGILILGGGKVLLNCLAGCDTKDVLDAMWLDWPDLW